MRSTPSFIVVSLALALAACQDTSTEPSLAASYLLATVDDKPVPAIYDSIFRDDGSSNRLYRILGRSLEIVSRDSAQYAQATDVVERLSDGSLMVWAADCTSLQVAYRRVGHRIILTIDPNILLLPGTPPRPITHDTLEVMGSGLVQWRREGPTIAHPEGRVWRLEYREGTPAVPVC
jgi:hypothetical protein